MRVGSGTGPADLRTGPFRGVHDLAGRGIENAVVERLEADADVLAVLDLVLKLREARPQQTVTR
jgi:hypothetical protein